MDQAVVIVCILFFALLHVVESRDEKPKKVNFHEVEDIQFHQSLDDYAIFEDELDGYSIDESPRRSRKVDPACWKTFHFWVVLVAVCDTIALYTNLLASHNISGSLRLIVQQSSIPLSMHFSRKYLAREFSHHHVAGALLVISGIVLCLINVLKGDPGQDSDVGWVLFFIFSNIPLAAGGCLKEWVLIQPNFECQPHKLNALVALYQFFIGLFFIPLSISIQNRDMDTNISFDEIPANFYDGFRCGFLGIDPENSVAEFGCDDSMISTSLYIVSVCVFNLLMLWIIREGTAVLYFVGNGMTIPLVGVISSTSIYSKFGLHRDTYTLMQFFGLLLTISGCFYFASAMIETSEEERKKEILRSGGSVISSGHWRRRQNDEGIDDDSLIIS